jgi:hypothetical protein
MDLAAARPNPAAPDPPLVPPTPGPAIEVPEARAPEVPEARAPEVPEARAPTPAPPVEPAAQPEPRVADRKESVPPRPEVHPNLGGLKLVTDAEAEPAGRSHVASDNKGQSVADFFRALLAARPPGNPAGAAPAESAAPTLVGQDARSPGPASSKDAAVSFDDFFGSPAGGASSPAQGSGDPSNDDLDQFQSWLQNLKR